MSSSSSLSVSQEPSTYDELSMHQSMVFSDSLKDLRSLRAQLYSAAEYFEVSYSNEDTKQIVVNTLKDYAVQALVNTVDHLGSVTYKVNTMLEERVDEVSGTELKVSCIGQRLRTCQEYIDREGLLQQSLVITTPKYHKRYIVPGGKSTNNSDFAISESTSSSSKSFAKYQNFSQDALRPTGRDTLRPRDTRSSAKGSHDFDQIRKSRSQSPSPRSGTFTFSEKRTISPLPTRRSLVRSGSIASQPTSPNPSNTGRRYPSVPRKSPSSRQHAEKDGHKEMEPNHSKTKSLLKSLLSRRKSKDDPMLYSYLDEY